MLRTTGGLGEGTSADEIAEIRGEVAATRDELERLDFTERMLVQVRERQELPAARDTPTPG